MRSLKLFWLLVLTKTPFLSSRLLVVFPVRFLAWLMLLGQRRLNSFFKAAAIWTLFKTKLKHCVANYDHGSWDHDSSVTQTYNMTEVYSNCCAMTLFFPIRFSSHARDCGEDKAIGLSETFTTTASVFLYCWWHLWNSSEQEYCVIFLSRSLPKRAN